MTLHAPHWLLVALPLLLFWVLSYRQLGRSRWVRLAMVVVLGLALADPRVAGAPPAPRIALLVDRSRSAGDEGLKQARALSEQLHETLGDRGLQLHVLGFGAGAGLLVAPGEPLEALQGVGLQDRSDLTAGLRLAAARLGPGTEVLVISDGLYTGDDPTGEAAALRARGIAVHTLTLHPTGPGDVAIAAVHAPSRATAGQAFSVGVEVDAPREADARLSIVDGEGREIEGANVRLTPGLRRYGLPVRPTALGLNRLQVRLQVAGDPRPQNNRATTAVVVEGAPRVLVYGAGGQATALHRALESAGLVVELAKPGTPLTGADLQGVAAVVLENIPLNDLGDGADGALDYYVRQMGGGLIVTGGRKSYAMGGYFRSELEELLPVVMDRQDELRRPRVDMAMVLDRSGSMGAPVAGGATKMDLANRGAAEAIALLAPGDKLGVLAVDSAAHKVLDLTPIGSADARRSIRDKVLSIEAGGGGIYVHTGLAAAMDMLLRGDAPTRHIILFSDAADAEEPGDYRALIARWLDAGGSLSVIGLGTRTDRDAALLDEMARLGGGQAYFTADAMQLPRIFAQDIIYISRKTFLPETTPVLPARGLLTLGMGTEPVPSVDGYNLTFLARGAEAVLVSGDDNAAPLAAAWQRGAGKVVAVTFEADGPHTGALAAWPQYKRFFRSALEWVKAAGQPPEVSADMHVDGTRATIEVELDPELDPPGEVQALVLDPDQRDARSVQLSWSGPHTLRASFDVGSDGIYQGVAQVPGLGPITLPPVMLPYSPEYAPRRGGRSGDELMTALAERTGGSRFIHVDDLARRPPQRIDDGRPLWPFAVALLLLLVVLDIAHRRGLLDPLLTRSRAALRLPRLRLPRRRAAEPTRTAEAVPPPLAAPDDPAPPEEPEPPVEPTESPYQRAKKRARLR